MVVGSTVIPVENIVDVDARYGEVEVEYRDDIEKGVVRTVKLSAQYGSTGVIVDDMNDKLGG
jgi:hypothetical protein